MDNELLKKIELLEKRITELESQKNDNLAMFGRTYTQLGSSTSDTIIRTRGQVKIQWGNTFIDLIKDGKINVNNQFIFEADSLDNIGSKDGIYVIEDSSIYIKFGETIVNLSGEAGTTYVSFLEQQDTSAEDKYIAMQNIGFLYPSIDSLNESSLQNGIIYVEQEQKLFIVKDGQLSTFIVDIPEVTQKQFIISKNDSTIGSLVIKGEGVHNSIAFDSSYIFTEKGNMYLQSGGSIDISVDSNSCIQVSKKDTTFKNTIKANTLQSINGDKDLGFMLYTDEYNKSTLIVDKIIERSKQDSINTVIHPTYWSLNHNVISSFTPGDDTYTVELKYANQYNIGDQLYVYGDIINEDILQTLLITLIVTGIDGSSNNIQVKFLEDSSFNTLPNFIGKITFLTKSAESINYLRYQKDTIDFVKSFPSNQENDDVILIKIGNLSELELEGNGIYSKVGYFESLKYTNSSLLDIDDNSNNVASTEWVKKQSQIQLPKGAIIAYHGSSIPQGWALCDGTLDTPNLIGKFIMGGNSEMNGNEISIQNINTSINATEQVVKINPNYYSLVFIMKIK